MKEITRYEMLQTVIHGNINNVFIITIENDEVYLTSWMENHGDSQNLDIVDMHFKIYDDEHLSDVFDIPGRNCGGMYYCDYEGSMPDEDIILNFIVDGNGTIDRRYIITNDIPIAEIKEKFRDSDCEIMVYLE